MLPEVVAALACPVCHAPVGAQDRALRCEVGHSFDLARQGYVGLRASSGARHVGDDAEMVAAREAFFGSGAYDGLAARVAEIARDAYAGKGVLLDVGGGTGFYAARALDHLARDVGVGAVQPTAPVGIVLDASPYALRRAARAHDRLDAVGCDLWQRWPLRDGSAGVAIGVFAPRNGAESARALGAGGSLIVVTPAADHLAELVEGLGLLGVDHDKDARVAGTLEPHLRPHSVEPYSQTLRLERGVVAQLVGMGPSARHVEPTELASRIARLPAQVEVTLSVRIGRWISHTS